MAPASYVILFLFLLTTGALYVFALNAANNRAMPVSLIEIFFQFVMFFGFVLVFPLLTMRLLAEEFKMGTIEPLMTAPVSDWAMVLSKYVAALVFYIFLWAPTALYFTITRWVSNVTIAESSGVYWTAYGLVFMMGMAYLAVGLLTSALTSSQVLAAIGSFSLVSILFYFGLLAGITSPQLTFFRDLLSYVSAAEHMNDSLRGILHLRAVVYYLSVALFALALTHRAVQYRRWRL